MVCGSPISIPSHRSKRQPQYKSSRIGEQLNSLNSNHQRDHYDADYDYLRGSPHLRHRHLYEHLTAGVARTLEPSFNSGEVPAVLEIGAGDGSLSERLLSVGCSVTATEMAPGSFAKMEERFGTNDRFHPVLDQEGDLEMLADSKFNLILFASVLHHIPDYLATLRKAVDLLCPGGALVTVQDPLWYPRLDFSAVCRASEFSFISWRLTQGSLLGGLKTRIRRSTTGLSDEAPGDAVEYHVVRSGVDELAIKDLLGDHFDRVRIESYWSSQGRMQQRIGERLGLLNTFAVFATGLRE